MRQHLRYCEDYPLFLISCTHILIMQRSYKEYHPLSILIAGLNQACAPKGMKCEETCEKYFRHFKSARKTETLDPGHC